MIYHLNKGDKMRIFFIFGVGFLAVVLLSAYLFMEPIALFASNKIISFYNDANVSVNADSYEKSELRLKIRDHTSLVLFLPVKNLFSHEKIPFKLRSDEFGELNADGVIHLTQNGYRVDANVSSKLANGSVGLEIINKRLDVLRLDFKDVNISNIEVNSVAFDVSKLLNQKYSLTYDGKSKGESTLVGKAVLRSNGVDLALNALSVTYESKLLASGNFLANINHTKDFLKDFNVSTNNDNAKMAGTFKVDDKDFKVEGYLDVFDLNATYSLDSKEANVYLEALNPSLMEDIISRYKLDAYKEYLGVHVNNMEIKRKLDENKTDVKFFMSDSRFPLAKVTKSLGFHCAETLLYDAFMAISIDDNLSVWAKIESGDVSVNAESIKFDFKEYAEGKLYWSVDLSKKPSECLKIPLFGKVNGVSAFVKNGDKIAHSATMEVANGKMLFVGSPKETYANINDVTISSLMKTFKKENKYFDGLIERMRFEIANESVRGSGVIKNFHFLKGKEIDKIATYLSVDEMLADCDPIAISFTSNKNNILVKPFTLKSKEMAIAISDISIDKKSQSISTFINITTSLHHIELEVYGSVSKPRYIINVGTIPKEIFSVIGGGLQGALSIPMELMKNAK